MAISRRAGQDATTRAQRRAGSIKLLSMGLLADEDQALMCVTHGAKAVASSLRTLIGRASTISDRHSSGTGDIAMTLARLLPQMGQLVVTTPTIAAQRVAARAADFARKSNIRVLGVIENMSGFICTCGERHDVFAKAAVARSVKSCTCRSSPRSNSTRPLAKA